MYQRPTTRSKPKKSRINGIYTYVYLEGSERSSNQHIQNYSRCTSQWSWVTYAIKFIYRLCHSHVFKVMQRRRIKFLNSDCTTSLTMMLIESASQWPTYNRGVQATQTHNLQHETSTSSSLMTIAVTLIVIVSISPYMNMGTTKIKRTIWLIVRI